MVYANMKIVLESMNCLAAISWCWLVGAVTVHLLTRRLTSLEFHATALLLGMGIVSIVAFIIGWLHVPWSVQSIVISSCLLMATALVARSYWWRRTPFLTAINALSPPEASTRMVVATGALIILGVLIASTTLVSILVPTGRLQSPDGYSFYLLKSRIFYVDGGITAYFNDHQGFGYTVPDHPPLVSLLVDWLYLTIGGVEQRYAALVNPIFVSTLLALLYAFARRMNLSSSMAAMLAMALGLSLIGSILAVASTDLAVSAYLMLAAMFALRWLTERRIEYAVISALGFGFAAWSKNEGLAMYYASSLTLLCVLGRNVLTKRALDLGIAGCLVLLLGPYLIIAPWLALKSLFDVELIQGGFSSLNGMAAIVERLSERAVPLTWWLAVRAVAGWNVLLLIAFMAIVVNIRRAWLAAPSTMGTARKVPKLLWSLSPASCYALLLMAGTLLTFLVGMLTSPDPLDSLIRHVTPRLISQVTPLFYIILAAEVGTMLHGDQTIRGVELEQQWRADDTLRAPVSAT